VALFSILIGYSNIADYVAVDILWGLVKPKRLLLIKILEIRREQKVLKGGIIFYIN
jgi:hypothetical protein